jgi:acetylornithine/succinyldiaminopimelate/putrescine aminotransferase
MPESLPDLLHKGFEEFRRFVNPLVAQRAALAGEPIHVARVEDYRLVDSEGHAFEDFHGTQAFGHRRPEIAAAVTGYLQSDAPSWFPSRVNPFAGRLGRRLYERTGYDNVFYACTGAGAIEAAIKLGRALTKRPRLLGLAGAYHGCTMGALSLMGAGYLRDPFGPHLPGAESLPFGDIDALAQALATEDVAVVIAEPIQGEGGVRVLPDDYVAALCELTEKHGTLLVADEVQTGMGRTGKGFLRSSLWPRRPDVVVLGKHIGGGLVPISPMLTSRETFLRAYGDHFASGEAHNNTMGNNGLSCVAALAALELLTDDMIREVDEKGARFKAALEEAVGDHEWVREVRGEGLMMGVALRQPDHPWLSFEHFGFGDLAEKPVIAPLLCHRLYKRGFFCFSCGHDWSIFRLQPRFDIPWERLEAFVEAVREELEYLCQLT